MKEIKAFTINTRDITSSSSVKNFKVIGDEVAVFSLRVRRSNGNYYGFSFSGSYNTAISDFNGFTITNNGGPNITSGNFKLYGIT